MESIKNIEKIKAIHPSWAPTDLAFVKSLKWSDDNLLIEFYSQARDSVKAWPDMSVPFSAVTINFKNVCDFKVDFKGCGRHQVSGFDIIDVSNNQLEKMNFEIEDYENGTIAFYCEEIEVVAVLEVEE